MLLSLGSGNADITYCWFNLEVSVFSTEMSHVDEAETGSRDGKA
jgi:hypothetical protein